MAYPMAYPMTYPTFCPYPNQKSLKAFSTYPFIFELPIMHLAPPIQKKKKVHVSIVFTFSWDNCTSQEK